MAFWNEVYKGSPPWDIGRPQPAFQELVQHAEIKLGTVLDVGCGTGENSLYLAQKGFTVVGVDIVPTAIRSAKAKAAERKLNADFRIGNALSLDFQPGRFDNAIDSGLFHTFTNQERLVYAQQLNKVIRVGGQYFMLCFCDKEPTDWGGPRRVSKQEIEETFSKHFRINYIRETRFADKIHDYGGLAYLTSATKTS